MGWLIFKNFLAIFRGRLRISHKLPVPPEGALILYFARIFSKPREIKENLVYRSATEHFRMKSGVQFSEPRPAPPMLRDFCHFYGILEVNPVRNLIKFRKMANSRKVGRGANCEGGFLKLLHRYSPSMEEERCEESVELVRFPFSNERKHPAHVVETVNLWGTESMKKQVS